MIDLVEFKAMFPEWHHCTDAQLSLWNDIADCMICLPDKCPALTKKLPLLMLAHILRINNVQCADPAAPATTDCDCDDSYLNTLLNGGTRISSVNFEGIAASFDNAGVNQLANSIGTTPFTAWLSMSKEGMMIAAILQRINKGPVMAVGAMQSGGVWADDSYLLGHSRLSGSGG